MRATVLSVWPSPTSIYDAEADLIATVFKPEAGALFLQRQIAAVQIDREAWQV
jgi:hypothetical protein